MEKEWLDLVSDSDQVIGRICRDEAYSQGLVSFRTVNAFIVDSHNRFWIPTRAPSKALWPNKLDASVGGHVKEGETYDQALIRETQEEVNLDLSKVFWQRIGKLTPFSHTVGSFMNVYIIRSDKQVSYNENDFSSGEWLELRRAIDTLQAAHNGKPDLLPVLQYIQSHWES